jgi:hypothetical protein
MGVIVTNLETPSRAVVRFYNKRGTGEQWIREGRRASKDDLPGGRTAGPAAVRSHAGPDVNYLPGCTPLCDRCGPDRWIVIQSAAESVYKQLAGIKRGVAKVGHK